ncbi:MAG: type II secretion system protein GspD [Candidatus Omnitrophota bacterium]|nr:MAG: type II secretion system protein GspD [Candidatus Omnitrophota bacterium]
MRRVKRLFIIGLAAVSLGLMVGAKFNFELFSWAQEEIDTDASGLVESESEEELISLDLKNVDIRELFKILAIKSGLTIMPSKEVKGRMNIFLDKVSFDDALDVILLSQDLAYEKKGNIITIMSASEYSGLFGVKFNERREFKSFKLKYAKPSNVAAVLKELKSEIGKVITDETSGTFLVVDAPDVLELMTQAVSELDKPLRTIVFDLNYAKPADVKEYLDNFLTPNVGRVVIDERTSKVVVSDLQERIRTITQLVSAFDEGSRQVAIATKIVEVTFTDRTQRGIDWRRIGHFTLRSSFEESLTAFGRINIGAVADDEYYVLLDFLRTQGEVRTLSQPQIVVVNNEEAKFLLGTRQPYVSQTQSQSEETIVTAEAIEFVDIGIKLNVTPTINKEGFITMKIKPEVSSISGTLTTAEGSTIPIVDTSEAETIVKVKDGTTLMVAGLVKDRDDDTVYGIPGLAKIPIIGGIFSKRDVLKKRTEFIVFLTPRIVTGALDEDVLVKLGDDEVDTKLSEIEAEVVQPPDLGEELWSKLKGIKEY